jgi:hypothetical protein
MKNYFGMIVVEKGKRNLWCLVVAGIFYLREIINAP